MRKTFFEKLIQSGVKRLIDVRLHNSSQLAGFAKRDDLAYFLRVICRADYLHLPILAPTQDIFDDYKKKHGSWDVYERSFLELMAERQVERELSPSMLDRPSALLCSEYDADRCHGRLVLEYLQDRWGGLDIVHL